MLDLEHETEQAEREQQRGDQRIGNEPEQVLGPVGIDRHHG